MKKDKERFYLEDMKKEMDKLNKKIKELEGKANEANKAPVISNPFAPTALFPTTNSGISKSNTCKQYRKSTIIIIRVCGKYCKKIQVIPNKRERYSSS